MAMWFRRLDRGWVPTATGASSVRSRWYVWRAPGWENQAQQTVEVCKLPGMLCKGFKPGRVSGTSMAFKSIVSKIPDELGGRPGAPWRTRGEAVLAAGPPFTFTVGETSETGLFFLGQFSPSLSLLSCLWGKGTVLIKVLGSSRSCNKLDAPKRCIIDTVLHLPYTELGLCILPFEKCIVM